LKVVTNTVSAGARAPTRWQLREWGLAYLLLLPTVIMVGVFTLWPTAMTLYGSLFRSNQAVRTPRFIGVGNYLSLIGDETFGKVMVNTITFAVVTTPICLVLAFLLALALNQKLRGIGLLRLGFFYPTVLPMVSAATIWLFLYTPDYGLVAEVIRPLGIVGQNWLGDQRLALGAVIVMAIWKQAGYYMIFYLAGMQNLPKDVLEAADIDGASAWQKLRYMTIPLLAGTTLFVSTIAVVGAFQTVDQLYVMTQGGPNDATNLLLFHIYETNFRFQDHGLAFAMSTVMIMILLIITSLNYHYRDRSATYG
jgi:sn-glycerol 3-phosphate transport system permease protein